MDGFKMSRNPRLKSTVIFNIIFIYGLHLIFVHVDCILLRFFYPSQLSFNDHFFVKSFVIFDFSFYFFEQS